MDRDGENSHWLRLKKCGFRERIRI
jgi:hypothetical protein